jgi:hypothetical protein
MAPVLNSPFAVGAANAHTDQFVTAATISGVDQLRYCYPSDTGVKDSCPPQSFPWAINVGIECCVKSFAGPSYTDSAGETIVGGLYIIAGTRYPESMAPIAPFTPVTFSVKSGSSVTVIGEGRADIPISGGTFTDTFDFAWTIRIYRVNP